MKTKIFSKKLWQCGLLAILLPAARSCVAQSAAVGLAGMPDGGQSQHAVPPFLPSSNHSSYSNDANTEAQARMRLVYLAQQKQMVKDTNRLVDLATKLDAEIASQHGAPLTPAERHELGQIEKLARSVRSRMTEPIPSGLFQAGNYTSMTFR